MEKKKDEKQRESMGNEKDNREERGGSRRERERKE